ncbi:MAG: response regulator transcription factor, partial [Clostridium celatum]|nr:response regulator transcription factor [Clostridium celatum]
MANEKILVVDDEEHIAELIRYNLESNGYKILSANNGIDAMKIVLEERPNLILLDLMIPGKDGYDVCKEIRSTKEVMNTPIIMLTAKSEEIDKILGLELGADDYITKPFSVRELLARVKAVLRRFSIVESEENVLVFGDLTVDFEKREVLIKNNKLELTLKEFELLEILIRNKG